MRVILLMLFACLGLSAQVTISPTASLTRDDAQSLVWWVERNFITEADGDANGSVSAAEARAWVDGKFSQMVNELVRRANEEREAAAPEELSAEYQAALDAYEQAKAALQALRNKK